jgi:hypothetical protein
VHFLSIKYLTPRQFSPYKTYVELISLRKHILLNFSIVRIRGINYFKLGNFFLSGPRCVGDTKPAGFSQEGGVYVGGGTRRVRRELQRQPIDLTSLRSSPPRTRWWPRPRVLCSFSVRSETKRNESEILSASKWNRRVCLACFALKRTVDFTCETKRKVSETKRKLSETKQK